LKKPPFQAVIHGVSPHQPPEIVLFMVKNFFKTTLRNWWKNKTNSFLNIAGLAIGIACAGLIFLWVESELGYDRFNTKKDRLYYVMMNQHYDKGIFTHGSTPGPLGPVMLSEMPGIANSCRSTDGLSSPLFSAGDRSFYAGGKYIEPSLFSMFTLPFVQGSAKTAFAQLHSMVITEQAAKKFFGNEKDVVGKTVRMDNKQDYIVSGVVKDLPENSTLQFEWVAPFENFAQARPWLTGWGSFGISTYVELKPGANLAAINKQLYNTIQKREPTSIGHPFLFNMNDWHLRANFINGIQTGGQVEYVHLFSIIAWIILFIACINFMNLSTARSERRAREVGVRKVLGAEKKTLIAQFMSEALLMSLLAAVVAMILMTLALPAFNTLVGKDLAAGFGNPVHIAAVLIIVAVCGLVAGSYPSLYLSSFNPVFVLKGIKLKTGGAALIRKSLVVIQFTVSIVLIIGTIIIYQQIQHVKSRDLGFNKDNLIEMNVQGDMLPHFATIKQELLNTGMVENVALTDHSTIYGGNNTGGIKWAGKDPNAQILVSVRAVSPEFISTSGIELMQGRDFHTNAAADSLHVIITESLAKLMGNGSAIGKTIQSDNETMDYATYTIVGVVKDYVYGNMYRKPDPVLFFCLPQYANNIYIRIKPNGNVEKDIAQIGAIMKKNNPAYPFDYRFVDEQFNNMFGNEMLISKLSRVFATLAIIISCLGLFGLAAYTAERRTKEIGIRKVLGASVTGITTLLSADFLKLIVLSALIAFPLAWWAMNSWLQGYPYRIAISWWVFIMAGLLSVLIAVVTISFQSIKAALMNPVKSLRTE
jgi:putative ABC transport system permease protein